MLGGGSLWRKMIRSATDRQYCLLDTDEDGKADHSVMINAGSRAARTPRAIMPVGMTIAQNVPISGDDEVRIRYVNAVSRGTSPVFELEIVQQGETREFDFIDGAYGETHRITTVKGKTGWPVDRTMLGAEFTILGVDQSSRSVKILWKDGVDRDRIVVISDGLKHQLRFGY